MGVTILLSLVCKLSLQRNPATGEGWWLQRPVNTKDLGSHGQSVRFSYIPIVLPRFLGGNIGRRHFALRCIGEAPIHRIRPLHFWRVRMVVVSEQSHDVLHDVPCRLCTCPDLHRAPLSLYSYLSEAHDFECGARPRTHGARSGRAPGPPGAGFLCWSSSTAWRP